MRCLGSWSEYEGERPDFAEVTDRLSHIKMILGTGGDLPPVNLERRRARTASRGKQRKTSATEMVDGASAGADDNDPNEDEPLNLPDDGPILRL